MSEADQEGGALDPLVRATSALRVALDGVRFPLQLPTSSEAAALAVAASAELGDYIIPRLTNLDAPALVVVGGSTGAGKSTLVNSVVGAEVTRPGVLRPTTRAPVLICHPDAVTWFDTPRILPELARVRGGGAAGANEIELVTNPAVGPGLALLDAPDIDSVVDTNRALAAQLLSAADLWVFVTTAARYADAVPWGFLHTARDRGTALTIVLNRVPQGSVEEIRADLLGHLKRNDLPDVDVIAIEEQPLTDGRIPEGAVAPLRNWLHSLASNHEARSRIVRRTLDGAITDLLARSRRVAVAAREQDAAAAELERLAREPYDAAIAGIANDVRDGAVLRGEVLARWQELVGTGELLRQLQSALGRLRDRISAALTGRSTATEEFHGAVENGLDTVIRARLTEAAAAAHQAWREHPSGRALLSRAAAKLDEPSPDLRDASARLVRDWQGHLVELLKGEGAGKRSAAKALSYGVNGLAAVLMVGVFAQTGGITGAELAIAGGGSVVGQKLLEALLGDQAVRTLADKARQDLDARVDAIAAHEWGRYTALIEREHGAGGETLDGAIAVVEKARAA